jgi:hypothetical protein
MVFSSASAVSCALAVAIVILDIIPTQSATLTELANFDFVNIGFSPENRTPIMMKLA